MLWGDCPERADLPEGPGVPEVPEPPESLDPPGYPGYLDYPDYPGYLGLPALVFTESHRAPKRHLRAKAIAEDGAMVEAYGECRSPASQE